MKKITLTILTILCLTIAASAAEVNLTDAQLQAAIQTKLIEQLGEKKAAETVSAFVMNDVLTLKPQTVDINKADTILAFAFGNSHAKNGNQTPGKMNEQLADFVVEIYNKIHKPVYAQWEIAQAIGNRIPSDKLHGIYPTVDKGGNLIYLNTKGVALDAVKQAGGFDKMGITLVVAFQEHALRAVNTAKDAGLKAYAPEGYNLPDVYDKNSGQPWTRDKLTFILYEIRTRANIFREKLDGKIYKK
jgi:hypothetical protein